MTAITLPKIDKAGASATVRRWFKKEGDAVAAGDVLVLMDSENAQVEIEASAGGILQKIYVAANASLRPGEALCEIGGGTGLAAASAPAAPQAAPTAPQAAPAVSAPAELPSGVTPVLMPQAGQSMEEGTLVKWRVQEGDTIQAGQVIFEIETDKATMEIESDHAGRVSRIVVKEGETVAVKVPVAYLAANDADVDAFLAAGGGAVAASAAPVAAGAPGGVAVPGAVELPAGVTPVLMPQAGQSMEEGTLVKWRVQPGDTIQAGQVIFEIETDKATMEIESDHAGRVSRIVVNEGETVAVKVPVAYLAENDAEVDAYLAAGGGAVQPAAQAAEAAQPLAVAQSVPQAAAQPSVSVAGRVKASPAARKIAAERGVDLASVPAGSGPGGRILSTDVLNAKPGARPAAAKSAAPAKPWLVPAGLVTGPVGAPSRKKMSGMRKAIAKNLVASKQNVPHFYLTATIDAGKLQSYYKQAKQQFKCSLNDLVILACGRVLHEFPAFRTRLEGEELVEYPTANVGMAVGLENGLVVPVALGVERLTLEALAAETRRLVESARGGSIPNMGQGVFTISNMGMFGIESFTAIINPPEAAILAVGGIRPSIIATEDGFKLGKVMTINLSCDHRVVDGMVGAKFIARLKELLENPELMD